MASTIGRVRFGIPDGRVPWIPVDNFFQACLDGQESYPYPHKTQDRAFTAVVKPAFTRIDEVIIYENTVIHVLKKISLIASKGIKIGPGSVLVGDIALNAPVIEIFDKTDLPVRTTLIPKNHLHIETDRLLIDGADVIRTQQSDFIIKKEIKLLNITKNSEWLDSVFKNNPLHQV
ncbi:MAG: hypothetical protein L0207_04860 [Chlamydiae bacterium]|nr:hypothetical protein [Chlamydiota bacterium]